MRVIDLQAPCDLPLRGRSRHFGSVARTRRRSMRPDAGPRVTETPVPRGAKALCNCWRKRCPGTLRAASPAGRPRSHLGSHARSSCSDWPDPRPLLRSRSPWVKERQDNLAAGEPARSGGRHYLVCAHRFSTPISTTSAARSSASFPYRRDRRWSRSTSWRRVTPASSCSPWTRTHTAPERPRDENQPICDAVESITTDKRQLPLFRRNSCLHRECVRYYQLSDGLTSL